MIYLQRARQVVFPHITFRQCGYEPRLKFCDRVANKRRPGPALLACASTFERLCYEARHLSIEADLRVAPASEPCCISVNFTKTIKVNRHPLKSRLINGCRRPLFVGLIPSLTAQSIASAILFTPLFRFRAHCFQICQSVCTIGRSFLLSISTNPCTHVRRVTGAANAPVVDVFRCTFRANGHIRIMSIFPYIINPLTLSCIKYHCPGQRIAAIFRGDNRRTRRLAVYTEDKPERRHRLIEVEME